jgi:hypothetical protein
MVLHLIGVYQFYSPLNNSTKNYTHNPGFEIYM